MHPKWMDLQLKYENPKSQDTKMNLITPVHILKLE